MGHQLRKLPYHLIETPKALLHMDSAQIKQVFVEHPSCGQVRPEGARNLISKNCAIAYVAGNMTA